MATAQSYQANLPDTSVTNAPNGHDVWSSTTGNSWWSKLVAGLGFKDQAQSYQNTLTQNNRAYEQALLREQRDYEEYVRNREYQREDTKMQRLIADYKAAGLNPWLALQGGISGTSAQSQPAGNGNFSSGSSAKAADKKENSGAIAGLLVAVARIVASVLA